MAGLLDERTEQAYVAHIIQQENGIYYVYDRKIALLPKAFQSKEASRFLAAIELLAEYEASREQLIYVVKWLRENQNVNGKWDMGNVVNDKVYFPLSDSWRKVETREADCTERISGIISKLKM